MPCPAFELSHFWLTIHLQIFRLFCIAKKEIDEYRLIVGMNYFGNKAVSFKNILFLITDQALKRIANVRKFFSVATKIVADQSIGIVEDGCEGKRALPGFLKQ
jgi:hypothetical protein